MNTNRMVPLAALFGLLLVGIGQPSRTAPKTAQSTSTFDEGYSVESRTAAGAHYICAGLWVVGRVYERTPEHIVAVARFPTWGWEATFEYNVDWERHRVTVRASPANSPRWSRDYVPPAPRGPHRRQQGRERGVEPGTE